MAAGTIIIELKLDGKTFTAELKQATGAVQSHAETSKVALGSATQAWALLTAGVGSAMFIVGQIKQYTNMLLDFGEAGAKVQRTEQAFDAVTKAAGLMRSKIVASLKAASQGMMDDTQIMQRAGRLIQESIPISTVEELTKNLAKQAPVVGESLAQAWDKFADALERGNLRSIKQYIGMVDAEAEYQKYADSIGVAVGRLSDEQKQATLAEVVNARLRDQVKNLGNVTETAATQIDKAKASIQASHEKLQKTAVAVVLALTEAWAALLKLTSKPAEVQKEGGIWGALLAWLPSVQAAKYGIKQAVGEIEDFEMDTSARTVAFFQKTQDQKKLALKALTEDQISELKKSYAASMVVYDGDVEAVRKKGLAEIDFEYDKNKKIYAGNVEMLAMVGGIRTNKTAELEEKISKITLDHVLEMRKDRIDQNEAMYLALSDLDDSFMAKKDERERAYQGLALNRIKELLAKEANGIDEREAMQRALTDQTLGEEYQADQTIRKWEYDRAQWILNINKSMAADMAKFTGNEYAIKAIEEEYALRKLRMGDSIVLEKWRMVELQKLDMERFNEMADFYKDLGTEEDKYRKNKLAWIDKEQQRLAAFYQDDAAAAKWANNEKVKLESDLLSAKLQNIQSAMGITANSFEQLSQLYAKDSSEQKRLHEISIAFHIAEKAAGMADAVVLAVKAIATQGGGDPYTAWPRIAGMTAAMVALLASAGISFGGSGGGGEAPAALPASSVLGAAAGTGSESAQKSLDLLEDTYNMEYRELSGIYKEMQDLNKNITGLVSSIVRTGGIGDFGTAAGRTPGSSEALWEDLMAPGISIVNFGLGSLLGKFAGWATGPFGNLFGAAFGGGTSQSVQQSGISITATRIQDLIDGLGVAAQQFALIVTKTEGGWFGSDTFTNTYQYGALDQKITDMFTLAYKNLGETLVELAKGLGTDVGAALNYTFADVKIDLKGMTGEQINKTLTEYFSGLGDTAVETLFGSVIDTYQQLGEGLMETAVRLVMDKAVVLDVLKMTGQSFMAGATNTQKLLQEATARTIAFSEAIITMAGGLDKLTEAAGTYFDKFFSDAEKQGRLQEQLAGSLTDMNMILPGTRDGYRALLEGLDLTTTSGQEAYVALLKLSGAADTYYGSLEAITKKRQDLDIQLMELTGDAAGALAAKRAIELAALDESLRPLQLLIYAQQDLNAANDAAAAAAQKQAEIAKTQRSLDIQLMEASGDTASALAARRVDELAAMDESLRATQLLIWARQDETTAAQAAATAAKELADAQASVSALWVSITAGDLADAQDVLKAAFEAEKTRLTDIYNTELETTNKNLDNTKSIVSDLQSSVDKLRSAKDRMKMVDDALTRGEYREAQAYLSTVLGQAKAGDFSAIANMDKTLETLTAITPNMYANSVDYKRDFNKTYQAIAELESLTGHQLTKEESMVSLMQTQIDVAKLAHDFELSALDSQMNALLNINTSVLSVADAISALAAAMGAATGAEAMASQYRANAALYTWGLGDWGGPEGYATEIKRKLGLGLAFEHPDAVSGFMKDYPELFAEGGSFRGGWRVVGEQGPELEYTGPSNILSNPKSKALVDNAIVIEELRALRAEVKGLKDSSVKVEKNTGKAASTLQTVTRGGRAMQTEVFV